MKRRGNLAESYRTKRMNMGGLFGKKPDGSIDTSAINAIGNATSGFINAVDPGDAYGVQSDVGSGLSGVASGAAAGAALGPPGVIGGAILGGITSLISNGAKKRAREQDQIAKKAALNKNADLDVAAKVAIDRRLLGDPNASMYKMGGTIKGKPAGKFALVGTLAGKYRGVRSEVPNIAVTPNRMMADGGIVPVDINGRAVVEGPDHKDGGVKVPELGVELEGGETLDGDFVFSKELGFADRHKKIMKGIKGTEKDDSPLAKHTRGVLNAQEEKLKAQQEELKLSIGLENEITNTAEEMKNINSTVPLKDQKGLKKKKLGGNITPLDLASKYREQLIGNPLYAATPELNINPVSNLDSNTEGSTDTDGGLLNRVEQIVPFVSNIANTFRKLPAVPNPILNPSVAPRYVNYNASRNETVRAVRGANKVAEAQLASSSATNAVNAANLTQGIRALNEVNQAEFNTNAQIANQTTEQNRQIARENNAKLEYVEAQKVNRALKQQELNSENLANFADKFQLQTRDRNLRSLEDDRLMLQIAQDNTGASWRAGRAIFKRRLTPESFKELDARMSELEKLSQEEREATLAALRQGISSLGVSGANTPSVLVEQSKKKK